MKRQCRWFIGIFGLLVLTAGVAGVGHTEKMPSAVTIDALQEFYTEVEFDHEMHLDVAEDCSTCHHHTAGTGSSDEGCVRCHQESVEVASVSCQACHPAEPFSAKYLQLQAEDRFQYHVDKPGLKAAYHWNCTGCHEAMDGPTGCADCHSLNEQGKALYRTGRIAPEEGTLPQGAH